MKYQRTASFIRDFGRLPAQHRRMFLEVVREHLLPAIEAGALAGQTPWPRRLRIHKLTDTAIYSLTWSFSSPDGRATFHLDRDEDGVPVLVWRRVGDHSIYDRP